MKADKLLNYLFYFSVLVFFIGFNFRDNPQGGWQLQLIDGLSGRSISDIFFLDSVNGWAVTPFVQQNDTAFVFKTTNGGNNWFISNKRIDQWVGYNKIKFINSNTGFACGTSQSSGYKGLSKSTDGGYNWQSLNVPDPYLDYKDMSILNEDTIWLVASSTIGGGVFRTTNGGQNFIQQLSAGNQNPDKIYMYNARIGFIGKTTGSSIRKTTDGGFTWSIILNSHFLDIYFIDSLTGWRSSGSNMYKSVNGGINWVSYPLPQGGNIITSTIYEFNNINNDTIWGTGGWVYYPSSGNRGILYRTTNGGINWHYQIPDTSFGLFAYYHIQFINKSIGWAYLLGSGIHTTTGGDTTFYTGIQQISGEVPQEFSLGQNYPNPFNSRTVIEYEIRKQSKIKITVYDITGKGVICLVDHTQSAGRYQVDFPGPLFPSGVYFYEMTADGKQISVKKMVMTK